MRATAAVAASAAAAAAAANADAVAAVAATVAAVAATVAAVAATVAAVAATVAAVAATVAAVAATVAVVAATVAAVAATVAAVAATVAAVVAAAAAIALTAATSTLLHDAPPPPPDERPPRSSDVRSSLKTYVDGQLCADVALKEAKASSKDAKGGGGGGGGGGAPAKPAPGGSTEAAESEGTEGLRRKEALLREVLCVEPHSLALFAPDADAEGASEPRVLTLKYLHVTTECLDLEKIRTKLHGLRGHSEAADLKQAADVARAQELSLQALYPRPPPAWLHPAFGAEVRQRRIELGDLCIALSLLTAAANRCLSERAAFDLRPVSAVRRLVHRRHVARGLGPPCLSRRLPPRPQPHGRREWRGQGPDAQVPPVA